MNYSALTFFTKLYINSILFTQYWGKYLGKGFYNNYYKILIVFMYFIVYRLIISVIIYFT